MPQLTALASSDWLHRLLTALRTRSGRAAAPFKAQREAAMRPCGLAAVADSAAFHTQARRSRSTALPRRGYEGYNRTSGCDV